MSTDNPYELRKWSPTPTGFDSWSNYIGPDFSEWYVGPVSHTRDSGILEESNWDTVTKDLLSVNTEIEDETGEIIDTVQIHRFGHWGPGWYEIILIHKSNEEAQKLCYEWAAALENYPVADDDDLLCKEHEAVCEYWEMMPLEERIDFLNEHGGSIFAARRDTVPSEVWDYINDLIEY